MRTEDLIGLLAGDDRPPPRLARRLLVGLAAALALSALVGLSFLGLRPDLAAALVAPVTAMKWLLPLAVGGAGLAGALRMTRPDRDGRGALGLALAVLAGAMLWLVVAALILAAFRLDMVAGLMLLPYLIWLSLAAALNFRIWRDNPGPA